MGRSRTGDRHGADRAFHADRGWAFKCPVATASSEYFNANVDVEPLKTVIIFSGIGLLLPLLAIQTYGLDLSVGFFFKSAASGRDYSVFPMSVRRKRSTLQERGRPWAREVSHVETRRGDDHLDQWVCRLGRFRHRGLTLVGMTLLSRPSLFLRQLFQGLR